MPSPKDDKQRKEELMKFHEQSMQGAKNEAERVETARTLHQESQKEADERAKESTLAEQKSIEKQKEGGKRWQKAALVQKEEIAVDKRRRADKAKYLKERKEKERKLEEAQRKFFNSFRESAARKALKEKELAEKGQEYKDAIVRAEVDLRERKRKRDAEEIRDKGLLDHKELEGRQAIQANTRKERDLLFGEEQRKKAELEPLRAKGDAVYRAKLQEVLNLYCKKRTALDADERKNLEFLRQKMAKERREIERRTQDKKARFDNDYRQQKSDLLHLIDKLKYFGVPQEGKE